jgi:hypothetical protein
VPYIHQEVEAEPYIHQEVEAEPYVHEEPALSPEALGDVTYALAPQVQCCQRPPIFFGQPHQNIGRHIKPSKMIFIYTLSEAQKKLPTILEKISQQVMVMLAYL